MRLPASTLGRLVLLALATLILSGCAGPRGSQVRRDAAAALYDRATLQYELDASELNLPLALTQVEGQLVSYESIPSHPIPGTTRGKLTVSYPHPNGQPGLALARVDITSDIAGDTASVAPPPSGLGQAVRKLGRSARDTITGDDSGAIAESWELTISKAELDAVVIGLNKSGYFNDLEPGGTGATISAKLDGGRLEQRWEPVPELDALMRRVRNDGQLVAYRRPPAFRPDPKFGSSVAAFRDLRERELFRGTPIEQAIVSAPVPSWTAGQHGLADPTPAAPSSVARLPHVEPTSRY